MKSNDFLTDHLSTTKNISIVFYGPFSSIILNNIDETDFYIIDSKEITELKVLLGTYTIYKSEIKFTDGILTNAIRYGKKIIFKNIDMNNKLLNFLKSLIERNEITINNSVVKGDINFRIIFTAKNKFKNKNIHFIGPINFSLEDAVKNISKYNNILLENIDLVYKMFHEVFGISKETKITPRLYAKIELCLKMKLTDRKSIYNCFKRLFVIDQDNREPLEERLRNFLCLSETETYDVCALSGNTFISTEQVINIVPDILFYIHYNLPILMIGETGTGKTSLIQYISQNSKEMLGYVSTLHVINMSNDIEIHDLLGCYQSNNEYVSTHDIQTINSTNMEMSLDNKANNIRKEKDESSKFIFNEGIFVKAAQKGQWILFDEINLAPKETLDALCAIMERKSIYLFEKGEHKPIKFHENFRIFACMNPGNDFGKKDFNSDVFTRFYFHDFSNNINEIYKIANGLIVDESNLNKPKLLQNARSCINNINIKNTKTLLENIAKSISSYFFEFKTCIENGKIRGNTLEPLISGRTFVRLINLLDSLDLKDILNLLFYTQIKHDDIKTIEEIARKYFDFTHYKKIDMNLTNNLGFLITKKNKKYIEVINVGITANLPILLQGPTSTGKTSTLQFLAKLNNVQLHRINNHENTEAADYIGNFTCDKNGSIFFKEGILIQAMKKGDWILLDELNLAPSEVLEILNRLLDDNKEILCNDAWIKPDKNFRIFATQNLNYGGRKGLSRAFRNRFVEVSFDPFDLDDIKELLECLKLPGSYINYIIQIYDQLSSFRSFNMLITIRDIFKWITRKIEYKEDLFCQGLSMLLEKQREIDDINKVLNIFENVFKLDRKIYYKFVYNTTYLENNMNKTGLICSNNIFYEGFLFTKSYIKLFNLLNEAIARKENILLIGETGLVKTKIIDIISKFKVKQLITMSMHQHIDCSDFIGSYTIPFSWVDGPILKAMKKGCHFLIDEINLANDSVLERLNSVFENDRSLYVIETDEVIQAKDGFVIFACMNPGNDFGKKELTPALRNRFTEVYFNLDDDEMYEIFRYLLYQRISDISICDRFIYLFDKKFKTYEDGVLKEKFSVRKLKDVIDNLYHLIKNCHSEIKINNNQVDIDWIFNEIFNCHISDTNIYNRKASDLARIDPYHLQVVNNSVNLPILSNTTVVNIKKFFKAMFSDKAILLKGNPGVGKTSFIKQIGNLLNKNVIRINLSEETEMCDLCGNYLSIPDENDKIRIAFIESEMIKGLRNSDWIILDEINLASQSVLEGLNSALDYRKEIYLNETIKIPKTARIFATMNNESNSDGRKTLPKSFIDRFTVIEMNDYTKDDIAYIIYYYIQSNETFKQKYEDTKNVKNVNYLKNDYIYKKCKKYLRNESTLRKTLMYSRILINNKDKVYYEYKDDIFTIGTKDEMIHIQCNLKNDYVLIQKDINNLFQLIKCVMENIPVILVGQIGKSTMVEFVSELFNFTNCVVYCYDEMDASDLLGQYVFEDNKIIWNDSALIENLQKEKKLIIFDKPEVVNKAVFDRLNSLFEAEKSIFIHEKGIDSKITVSNSNRFVFLCDNLAGLSNAIIDRCWIINLNNKYNIMDMNKIYNAKLYQEKDIKRNKHNINNNTDNLLYLKDKYENVDIDMITPLYNNVKIIPFITNKLRDSDIIHLLNLSEYNFRLNSQENYIYKKTSFNELLQFYKSINYSIKTYDSDILKIRSLCKYNDPIKKVINFVKNGKLSFMNKKPNNIDEFKFFFIKNLIHMKIKDYKNVKKCGDMIAKINIQNSNIEFDPFYFEFFNEICGLNNDVPFDPILLLKIEFMIKTEHKYKKISEKLTKEFLKSYKYGKSNIEKYIDKYKKLTSEIQIKLEKFNKVLNRNFIERISLCQNMLLNDKILELKSLNVFGDIVDYFNIMEYKNSLFFEKYSLHYLYFVLDNLETEDKTNFINLIKKYNIEINNEFSKQIHSHSNLLYEIFFIENKLYEFEENDKKWLDEKFKYDSAFFTKIFKHLFNQKNEYKLEFYPNNRIEVTNELIEIILQNNLESNEIELTDIQTKNEVYDAILDKPLFTSTVDIINNNKIDTLKTYYQKCKKNFDYNYNYSWYLILYLIDLNTEKITEYLLNTKIYQYLERQYFISEFLNKNDIPLLYNISLQYKAFEIQENIEKIKKERLKKVWYDSYEINKYKNILEEETINHLNEIKIDPKIYKCSCLSDKVIYKNTFNEQIINLIAIKNEKCRFDNCDLDNLECLIDKNTDVSYLFYNRKVQDKFSKNEILLAKIFNEYISVKENLNSEKLSIVERLFKLYLEETICVRFLLIIYNYIQKHKKYEEDNSGDGLKEGQGNENISKDIKNEEEVNTDENFNELEEINEDDAIEMSNEGCIDDIEDTEENENEDESENEEIKGCDDTEDNISQEENESILENNGDQISEENSSDRNSLLNNSDDESSLDESDSAIDGIQQECSDSKSCSENENSENESFEYEKTENKLNNEQICENAENYFSFVEGNNQQENALKEGEGEGFIEEEGLENEKGTKIANQREQYSKKEIYDQIKSDSFVLANTLKYVFEGNKRNKFCGDFKSGKRLNLKKIIPFILSDYKKDKIWLRRTRAEKRDYLVRIFVDASKSMNNQEMIQEIFSVFKKIIGAFDLLEITYEIYEFGNTYKKRNNLDDFINNISFDEIETNLEWMKNFTDGINIVLTDGVFQIQSERNDNFIVLLIDKKDIKNLKKIKITEDGIKFKKYLDSLNVRFCVLDSIKDVEKDFIYALKEMIDNQK